MASKPIIAQGIKWTSLSTIFSALNQFVLYAILTRLLNLDEFALIALIYFFTHTPLPVLEATLGYNLLIDEEISLPFFQKTWTLGISSSALIYLVLVLLSPFISAIYANSELSTLIIYGGLILPFFAFGMPYRVLLKRRFSFPLIAKIQLVANTFQFTLTLFLALKGWGCYSIIIGFVAKHIIENISYWLSLKRSYPLSFSNIFDFNWAELAKGFFLGIERIIEAFTSQADILIISYFIGLEALGIYDLSKRFLFKPANLLSDTLESVMLPVIAHHPEEKKSLYYELLTLISSILFPLFFVVLTAYLPITQILFSDNANAIAPIFYLMTIAIIIRIPRLAVDTLVLSQGKSQLWLKWRLIALPITIFFLLIGAQFDFLTLILHFIFLQLVLSCFSYLFLVHPLLKWPLERYINGLLRPFLIAFVCWAIVSVSGFFLKDFPYIFYWMVIFYILCYSFITLRFNKPLIQQFLAFLKN